MNENLKYYYDYTISPLGQLFYQSVWEQLPSIENKKVLDFGSGFGFTSAYISMNNEVTSIEKDEEIIKYAKEGRYKQLNGDYNTLKSFEDKTFDVIICHLVFEFIDDYSKILKEFSRILKEDGFISIVRHNKPGRIIQALTLEEAYDEVSDLLDGKDSYSPTFGDIKYLKDEDILSNIKDFYVESSYGVRVFASLQTNEMREKDNWIESMMRVERKVYSLDEYKNISYFNHLILRSK